MTKDGGAAFPQTIPNAGGMTVRQWYAGQAMAGLMMKYSLQQKHFEIGDMETVAKYSFMFADAMLAEDAAHEGGGDGL
jgi:hypothetical protein